MLDNDFVPGGTTYTERSVRYGVSGNTYVWTGANPSLPESVRASLVLQVGGRSCNFSDSTIEGAEHRWDGRNTARPWTAGAELTARLVRSTSAASLSNLTLSDGTLSPPFDRTKTSYTATVANTVEAVTVTPTTRQSGATVSNHRRWREAEGR